MFVVEFINLLFARSTELFDNILRNFLSVISDSIKLRPLNMDFLFLLNIFKNVNVRTQWFKKLKKVTKLSYKHYLTRSITIGTELQIKKIIAPITF